MTNNELYELPQVFSIRLTNDDHSFVKENADQLFGDSEKTLSPRTAFLHIVEKALSRKQVVKDQADQSRINELSKHLAEWENIKKQFEDYLIIAQKEKLAENYQQMFARWLSCIQNNKREAWTLDENDKLFIKKYHDERTR